MSAEEKLGLLLVIARSGKPSSSNVPVGTEDHAVDKQKKALSM